MVSPSLAGRLRRVRIWDVAQKAHRLVGPPICGVAHRIVGALGPERVPLDLALKHHYDYVPVHMSPEIITGRVSMSAGMRGSHDRPPGLPDRYRTWRNLSGGWKSVRKHFTRNIAGRFIADGDWDLNSRAFEPVPSVFQIFVEGARPESTAEYQRHIRRVGNNDFAWTRGFRSEEEVADYFADLVRIYEDMSTGGYRTQLELGRDGADEIRVCIDRDGHVSVFGGGTHRLSMALLLEIPRVPVLIKRVHSRWVADYVRRYGGTVRSAIARGVEDLAGTSSPYEENPEKSSRVRRSFSVPRQQSTC